MVCCSHQSDRRIRVCISHQSDCRIRVCMSHQSYHSVCISCTNHSVWVLFSCKWCHGIRGLRTKNDINQKSWAHLKSFMIVPFKWVRSRFFGIWKVRIYFYCIIFSDKTCFFRSFSHNAHAKQLKFHHVLWKHHPKSNYDIPNHCTTWTWGNCSLAWNVFYQSNSILSH